MAASKDKARAILSYATPNPVGPYRLITPPTPDLGAGKTKTPVMPVMGGTLVNLPTPVKPTKQVTPVAPPLPDRLVNVPKQQGRVVDKNVTPIQYIVSIGNVINDIESRKAAGGTGLDVRVREYSSKLVRAVIESNPAIRNRYETTLEQNRKNPVLKTYTEDQLEYAAAKRIYSDLLQARTFGFSETVAPNMTNDVSNALNYMIPGDIPQASPNDGTRKADRFRKIILSQPDSVQETIISLAPGWTGTFKELVDASRSLSK